MNETVVEARNLIKHYKDLNALDNVNLKLTANRIYGLLGRNGAGKTTLMSILTAQAFATSGEALVFGASAYENEAVLSRICFIRESQKYPDDFQPHHAFRSAALFYKNWDQGFAERLAEEFQLPLKRRIKKLSRGQLSAVGVIIGLASRAELTFFDEPYLGLDAVARQLFYDRLVEDYAQHPRTIILSSHLIDEVANLLEHVVVIDHGKIIMDADAEEIRGSAVTVSGSAEKVDTFLAGRRILHRETLGSLASVTVDEVLSGRERTEARELGLELSPVSLQQLVVRKTMAGAGATETAREEFADHTMEARR
ncbi:ABC transporter ATP-binding protein [Paenarthrobacter aurescens]|uniref:ABC transporter ATP-binding protein n=1 Tax=Paenarthrobacter aurescens TaxID=43663 RepID=A0A4Y3NIB2_PAEAU|nr:ABC transporter ATP-binding protein [Paenarthrobacter aurescens]MDO6143988.1 ABC transporter ATP-binding protein [Paenarthrobacter aurescens]MDO6147835.1 ABC transporter ATP-binding protein [Paenarthrobacter aurescens]MDO6159079.1 ABC transporter ATP-binding protein [Paenarthrobacter aurescens]MDO6163063.1 ABC transporter ATP-binding protein [Paenarthrobacter aurescens]GEB18459.1 ABC transporter ATP-binding protein [Paenarthrobacter aurescens]